MTCLSTVARSDLLLCAQELLPDFRPVLEAYFEAMLDLGRKLMRLLALCLDLPPTWCAVSSQITTNSNLQSRVSCVDMACEAFARPFQNGTFGSPAPSHGRYTETVCAM